MKLSRLLAAALLLAAAPSLRAADDETKTFLDPANWEGRSDIFKIENGTIVGETTEDPKYNTFFVSKKKYGDFELSAKVKLRDGIGNSGIQVRSVLLDPKKFIVGGPQVDAGQVHFGSLYGERVGGYLLKAKGMPAKGREGEVNDYHVLVKGNHITIKVNDQTTIDEDFPDDKGKNPAPAEGVIAFQIHGGFAKMRVEFTDIKFTELSKK
ncbi:MAG: 3-keto-disaccharide hydrolase [Fimbriiglobus sp.]